MTKASKTAVAPTSPPGATRPGRGATGAETPPADRSRAVPAAGGAAPKGRKSASTGSASSKRSRTPTPTPEAPVADRFLDEQRNLLLSERAVYTQQAESLRAEAEQLAEDMEPGDIQFDEESGEGGTINVERERDLALSAQAMSAIEEIDRALAKLEGGTYGVCERCGQPIKKARLKALPYASLCVECKTGGLSRR